MKFNPYIYIFLFYFWIYQYNYGNKLGFVILPSVKLGELEQPCRMCTIAAWRQEKSPTTDWLLQRSLLNKNECVGIYLKTNTTKVIVSWQTVFKKNIHNESVCCWCAESHYTYNAVIRFEASHYFEFDMLKLKVQLEKEALLISSDTVESLWDVREFVWFW